MRAKGVSDATQWCGICRKYIRTWVKKSLGVGGLVQGCRLGRGDSRYLTGKGAPGWTPATSVALVEGPALDRIYGDFTLLALDFAALNMMTLWD